MTTTGGRSELTGLTAAELAGRLSAGEVSSVEVTQAHLDRIAAVEPVVHAFLHVDSDGALAAARKADEDRAAGRAASPLAGVPLALKDVLATSDMPTTCGSKMLENWTPPYDATVTRRLREAGIVVLGKTNMDEFAMGSSTENSAYGPTRNPWNTDRIPGGSGGGSSASLAAFEAPLAIGTDTGGSIRQPGAVTGTVGVKPTYGGVSRYGLVAFSSSLDQPGPCARTVLDAALLHEAIAGHDPMDSTSIDQPVPQVVAAAREGASGDLKGVRVGVVREFSGDGYQPGVQRSFQAAVDQLAALGAEVVEVSCPHFDYALPAYYLIAPSEASSNLARFDAMRYGLRVGDDSTRSAEEVMSLTREAGFGPEVKRRIMLGTYALSSGYYDAYYGQAQKVRTLITRDFDAAFAQVDVLVSPTTPTTAFEIGARVDDPMAMYLADLCTIPANLAGNAAMSVPSGLSDEDGLPVGLQIMAPTLADDRLYRVGAAYETARDAAQGGPLIDRVPELEVA
ncbi:aspartyl/glutamyl-tRNA(Asn/Gln) amidotransferase subunit A [Saccharopolyspora erythraea NRRL 2338]|uniref:Glutamyl-tRNA(Gln) amidotransferase subunit A n=2 Tax=Saccharopolyspora erythraea TaxID=1836 RepID=A4FMS1_SACEN|nr:Asp-tRNA(Asn)/Glu-tRNA(Gln) amidotransferase subunit GatA [Saccharopolyspora erythraea]EQD85925.1 glutamyl-tRNA amidotransferase subunit A [Saccharopolyspora erythraea D]PFG98991.1 aspartyl/glutamyl-tRNA(Asn/Gln) amidotransferase subunit A [Saccharopolyspora erythraea NRRL 2338]QRK88964.1 Asp-tRNA(Asn)/Glu-tRNA(Gln) amidotransferase subunit GatA [Saccharopolyspora erythraea]CAM05346.1 glutamyl-tRNA(Gln) amidotransferase, subunit A [Saccharopolyspora erythraea NRRL 2338]